MDRRAFLSRLAAGAGVAGGLGACAGPGAEDGAVASGGLADAADADLSTWPGVRAQFPVERDPIPLSALILAAHPYPVRRAIARYRAELDGRPTLALEERWTERTEAARRAAARHLDADAAGIALTGSTTAGLALVYRGIPLRPGQEILTTEHDHYATHGSARLAAERAGASVRKIPLYERSERAGVDEVASRIAEEIRPETRVLGLTWVHSDTGLRLPMEEIGRAVETADEGRAEEDRLLVVLDGVHGLGVEDAALEELGCDFFVAGCHKWLFGPRGTGIVAARPETWRACTPLQPSFIHGESWQAWAEDAYPPRPSTASSMSPGGFHAFEHRWALAEAFDFHDRIGRERVAERTHALARRVKEGLSAMAHVHVHTPLDGELSSGIVCFDVDGMASEDAVGRIRDGGVVATTSPYRSNHARLSPAIYNTPAEVDRALEVIRGLA